MKLVQTSNPWDPTFIESLPSHPESPSIPLPTDEELRKLSRTPRAKSPGPDGIPPYLLYILPENLFHWIASGIRLSLQLHHLLPHFLNSVLVGIFKNKERWWEPSSWRPICMSTASYRIGARYLKSFLLHAIRPHIHPHQYGALPRRTTAFATLRIQEILHSHAGESHLFLLDITNAFSSAPFPVVIRLLEKAGVPPQILSLVQALCYQGYLYLTQQSNPHRASSGARQGCPLSTLIFTSILDTILQATTSHSPTAFMDDLALIFPSRAVMHEQCNRVIFTMERLRLRVNLPKCDWMPSNDSGGQ